MVGPTKLPFSYPGTLTFLPSSRISAPWSIPDCTRSQTLCLASGEMTGPRSAPGSWPTAFHKQPYSTCIWIMLSNTSFVPKLHLLGSFWMFHSFQSSWMCVVLSIYINYSPSMECGTYQHWPSASWPSPPVLGSSFWPPQQTQL